MKKYCYYLLLNLVFLLEISLSAIIKTGIAGEVAISKCDGETSQLKRLSSLNKLTLACTSSCFICSALVFLGSCYFQNYFLPQDFAKQGKITQCLGIIVRLSMSALSFSHWLLFLPVFIVLIQVFAYPIKLCDQK